MKFPISRPLPYADRPDQAPEVATGGNDGAGDPAQMRSAVTSMFVVPPGHPQPLKGASRTEDRRERRTNTQPAGMFQRALIHKAVNLAEIIGESDSVRLLRQQIAHFASLPTDIFIIGETGTGKDLATRSLHELSGRPGPFVALNCGAIPDSLFESELFGHQAGSFTGATKSTVGKIEQAHQGTLFLDEIESMPMNQQVKLLRVLETRQVERVGGRTEIKLDLRVVAASKDALEQRCKEGSFRSDLWHRLNVITLSIPPLRERRQDIPLLFSKYHGQACQRFGVRATPVGISDMARLVAYDWPGNVRELKHAADRLALGMPPLASDLAPAGATPQNLAAMIAAYERELVRLVLQRYPQDLAAAAAELGVSEKTLSRRMQEFGLARNK